MAGEPPLQFVPTMAQGAATVDSVEQTLQGALDLLNGGTNWVQGSLRAGTPNGPSWCVVGALEAAAPNYESYAAARDAVKQASGNNHIDRWNNDATWPEVQQALTTAERNVASTGNV